MVLYFYPKHSEENEDPEQDQFLVDNLWTYSPVFFSGENILEIIALFCHIDMLLLTW